MRLISRIAWALFGNDDDGPAPDFYRPSPWVIALCWWFRNPAHNLTFYVIGFKGRARGYRGFNTDAIGRGVGWTERDDGKRFPFLVWNSARWMRCAGWRPSGAFEIKCHKRQG